LTHKTSTKGGEVNGNEHIAPYSIKRRREGRTSQDVGERKVVPNIIFVASGVK